MRVIHHLYGRIVLHQSKITVHIIGGFTDGLADKLAGGIVIGFQNTDQLTVFRRQRLFSGGVIDRPRFRFRLRNLPFAAVVIEHQIDHSQMVAPHAVHYRRNAVKRTFGDIRAFDVGKIFTGEDGVSVAKHNRVDAELR